MKQTIIKYFLLTIILTITACAGQHDSGIYLVPNLSDRAIDTISLDMTGSIGISFPAKSTRFILPQDRFGQALSDRLGKVGYETTFYGQQDPQNTAQIRYTIDRVNNNQLYIALTINNTHRYIRSYIEDNGNFTPLKITIKGRNDE